MTMKPDDSQKKLTGLPVLMLVLSVYVLIALFADTAFHLPVQVSALLRTLDTIICFVFLGDFFHHLYRAENRPAFLKWGWVDFISSIPLLTWFRWGRVVPMSRVSRILRGARSVKHTSCTFFLKTRPGEFLARWPWLRPCS